MEREEEERMEGRARWRGRRDERRRKGEDKKRRQGRRRWKKGGEG